MNKALDEIIKDSFSEGREELLLGLIAKKIQKGFSFDAIADMLEITVEEVTHLSAKLEQ